MVEKKSRNLRAKRYLISGIMTVIPLWVTWLVLAFTFRQLSKFGKPLAWTISTNIQDAAPHFSRLLLQPWFLELLGFLIVIIGLYVLGWVVNRVVGRQLLNFFERLVDRLPLVHTVYGSVKKLVSALQTKPDEVERVVLIEFPNENMKTVGLVTCTMTDSDTGQKLAAVYVPTTPNPTSGYLEIVPVDRLVSTNWTIDEAMNFVVSGGAIAPERFAFSGKTASGLVPEPGGK
jgi:uncharacterized membrane protein